MSAVAMILHAVATKHGVDQTALASRLRTRKVVDARAEAIRLLLDCGVPVADIARALNRSVASIRQLHARRLGWIATNHNGYRAIAAEEARKA